MTIKNQTETSDKTYSLLNKFIEESRKRWVLDDKRWAENDKHWVDNKKDHQKIVKRFDYLFNGLDKEVMADRKRIGALEEKVSKYHPVN